MRKLLILAGLFSVLAQPIVVLADESTTVEKTTTQVSSTNPFAEVLLFPVRLVTGVIGVPIGAVGGAITGFGKGFAFPFRTDKVETSRKTTISDPGQ